MTEESGRLQRKEEDELRASFEFRAGTGKEKGKGQPNTVDTIDKFAPVHPAPDRHRACSSSSGTEGATALAIFRRPLNLEAVMNYLSVSRVGSGF